MRSVLALAVLLASPGTPAWAQVARVIPRTPAGAVAPAFAPRLAPPTAPLSTLPALSVTSALPLPLFAVTPTVPLPLSRARERVGVRAAELPSPRTKVSAALAETALAAAPHIEAAAEAGGSAAQGHEAGAALEKVLTGELRRPAFGSPVAAFNACDSHPSGLQRAGAEAPPAGAAEVPAPARRAFGLYTAGVSTVKAGIETLNLVVPILLLSQYGAASVLGGLFVAAQVAALVGGAALAPLIDRIGPARTLAAAAAAQAAVIGVVPLSVFLGAPVSLPVLFGLFALNGALSGVFDVARRSAPPTILGSDEGTLRRYNARLYIARELAAMGAVFGAGWLLHSVGPLATLGVHPAAYVAAAGLFLLLARMRAAARTRDRAAPPPDENPGLPSRWSEFAAGARIVLADPALRLAALVNIPVIALHNTFHAMLAAVYATSVLGSPALAAVLIGAWNAGELAAALFLERRGERTSAAAWVRFAAVAGLSSWALWAFPTIWVAAPVAFVLAAAMLGNEIGLNSFFQAAAPKQHTAAVTGFVYSGATGAAMLLMLAMGWVFDAFGALPGFLALAAALTAVGGLYVFAARALARRTETLGASQADPSTPSS